MDKTSFPSLYLHSQAKKKEKKKEGKKKFSTLRIDTRSSFLKIE